MPSAMHQRLRWSVIQPHNPIESPPQEGGGGGIWQWVTRVPALRVCARDAWSFIGNTHEEHQQNGDP